MPERKEKQNVFIKEEMYFESILGSMLFGTTDATVNKS